MSQRGLLARLGSAHPSRQISELDSVIAHLRALLNTSLGDSASATSLGIVDLTDLIHNFPASTYTLQRSIRETISRFEPRLQAVVVHPIVGEDAMTLHFQISARLAANAHNGPISLRTSVRACGRIEVQ